MLKGNFYRTIKNPAKAEFIEKKSRFLGYIAPIKNKEHATVIIDAIKKENYNASHNVFAYKLINGVKRYSDDGEPQGTAGIPVLDVIEKEELEDLLIIVTRYFGGTKLGGGGLVRAYSRCAKIVIDASDIVILKECEYYTLELNYDMYGLVKNIIGNMGSIEISAEFSDVVEITVKTEKIHSRKLLSSLQEISSNTIKSIYIKTDFSEM